MHLNFALYIFIASGTAFAAGIGTDEAAKYLEPETLFWIRLAAGVAVTTATAAKAYTSKSFSEWSEKRKQPTQDNKENEGSKTT